MGITIQDGTMRERSDVLVAFFDSYIIIFLDKFLSKDKK